MKRPMTIAILCGIVTALCVALYLNSLEYTYRKGAQKMKVLVAKQYIGQGEMIDASMVEERAVPKEYIQPRAIAAIKELTGPEGRPVFMAVVPVEKGEQLAAARLATIGTDTGIASLIPDEHRAITLLCDLQLVNGIIRPGNRVDTIGVFSYEDADRNPREGAFTVLQGSLVLAVGRSVLGMGRPGLNDRAKEPVPDESLVPVSLSVTPEEAVKVTLAAEKGTIRFALRPVGDTVIQDIRGIKLQDIARDMNVTVRQVPQTEPRKPADSPEARQKQREVMDLLKKYQSR